MSRVGPAVDKYRRHVVPHGAYRTDGSVRGGGGWGVWVWGNTSHVYIVTLLSTIGAARRLDGDWSRYTRGSISLLRSPVCSSQAEIMRCGWCRTKRPL